MVKDTRLPAMHRGQRPILLAVGAVVSSHAVDAAAAASERFTLDVYAGSALVGRARYYEFLTPTDGGGQSASRVNVRHSSPVVALAMGGTYRLKPFLGLGLEG